MTLHFVPLLLAILAINGLAAFPLVNWLRGRGGNPRILFEGTCLLSIGVGALAGFLEWADLSMDQAPALVWGTISVVALFTSLFLAKRWRCMPNLELGLAGIVALQLGLIFLMASSQEYDLASAPIRTFLVAPAVVALWGAFGLSLGYLLWGKGEREFNLGYEFTIGRRFLLSKSTPVLSTVTTISLVGVSLGVWLIIVGLAVLGGFEADLRKKIIGANAHATVKAYNGDGYLFSNEHRRKIEAISGVSAASPFIETEVAFAGNQNYVGGLLLGIDPSRVSKVLNVFDNMNSGALSGLASRNDNKKLIKPIGDNEFARPASIEGIVLGVEMASSLGVSVGDRINVISPFLEVLTPIGPAPRMLGFEVVGIFSTKMYEYDSRNAYVHIKAAERFFQLPTNRVSGTYVSLDDPDLVNKVQPMLEATLGSKFEVQSWKERNQTLFAALKLERMIAFVVLAFIILVASFSIVNTLTMSIIEKQKEIAILMTMGASAIGVMKIFLVQGILIGGFGTLIGTTAGILSTEALKHFKLWIPSDVYYIDSLPVYLDSLDVVMVALAALLIVWDFAVFPALRGSQLKPVEGLREG